MQIKDTAILAVDCYAAIVPEGTPIVLNKGMQVEITQNLGGQVTAIASGHLVRIRARMQGRFGASLSRSHGH